MNAWHNLIKLDSTPEGTPSLSKLSRTQRLIQDKSQLSTDSFSKKLILILWLFTSHRITQSSNLTQYYIPLTAIYFAFFNNWNRWKNTTWSYSTNIDSSDLPMLIQLKNAETECQTQIVPLTLQWEYFLKIATKHSSYKAKPLRGKGSKNWSSYYPKHHL